MLSTLFLATVISISDGDTLTVLKEDKQQVKIRLAEIDAPEKRQLFGAKSKQSLSDICFGKKAEIRPRVKDRYGRTVARISCDGVDANAEQVNRGITWVYRQYAKDHNLFILQHEARRFKRGLWSEPSPIPPWEWRKTIRQTSLRLARYA